MSSVIDNMKREIAQRCVLKAKRFLNRSYSKIPQTPLLMVFADQESRSDSVLFFTTEGKRVRKIKNRELCSSRCVGSSHGWLVLLDESADPYLLNPFSGHRILLPAKQYLPHVKSVYRSQEDYFEIEYNHETDSILRPSITLTAKELQDSLVVKAVLSCDPEKNNYSVIAIYGYESKLAYVRHGGNSWTDLSCENRPYCDIICYKNRVLFALSEKGSIEAWDLGSPLPAKLMDVHPRFPANVRENSQYSDSNRYSSKIYLVESFGDLLLVVRYIGEFVGEDGVAVCKADLLTDEDSHPLVCPYKTLEFQVFKLNLCPLGWEWVESLGDRVLFLGGNHSLSLPFPARDSVHYKKNSVYFTDDYLEKINENYLYGGHDVGVFSLEDKTVQALKHCGGQRSEPPPVWVVPNLM